MPDLPADQTPFTPVPDPPPADAGKLGLGARLFSTPILSGDGRRACTSCHDLQTNGADGRRLDSAPDGTPLRFNTTTVFNAALSFRLGWEGHVRTLEKQAADSLESPAIMATTVPKAVAALQSNEGWTRQFQQAYGHGPDRTSLLDAIATFERSLLTPGSRFDRWLRGDASALSDDEKEGYRLFTSFGCASCHQGVNIGANLFERHGIFHPLAAKEPEILRVPSLRNVATTAPYFQDGSAATLDEAVRKMAYAQLDRDLTDGQVQAIVAFLRTLTGVYHGRPVTAPAQ